MISHLDGKNVLWGSYRRPGIFFLFFEI